jgi:hypothetical protein
MQMKRYERGQGLIEYLLFLFILFMLLDFIKIVFDSEIGGLYCEIVAIGPHPSGDFDIIHEVSMDPSDTSVTFDVKYGEGHVDRSLCYDKFVVEDVGEPSHGQVKHLEFAAFTYWPNDPGSGTDDSFTFSWSHSGTSGLGNIHTGLVTIIVGERDQVESQSIILGSAMITT